MKMEHFDLFNSDVPIGKALGYSVLGIAIVFLMLIVLMLVIQIMAKALKKKSVPADASVLTTSVPVMAEREKAPGSAGNVKLYDVPDKDAAMIMAIVADKLGKPLNELRFISIKEVK